MNFLGMGPLELMLIVVLALIVFGPAKLPEIMGQIGRAISDFRRATSELSDEFNRTIQAELNETKQTIEETKSALTEVRSAVDSTMSETRAAVTGMPAPQRIAAPAPAVETNGLGHEETTTNGSASAPAMADTSQWSWETSPARPESEQTEPLPRSARTQRQLPMKPPRASPFKARPSRRRRRSQPRAPALRKNASRATSPSRRTESGDERCQSGLFASHTMWAHTKEWPVIEVFVESIRVNMTNYRRVVMLKEKTSPRYQ